MIVPKIFPFACLALSVLLTCSTWAQSAQVSAPMVSVPKGIDTTEEARQEWRRGTLQIARKLESISRVGTTHEAYKNQLAETAKELEVALKDAQDEALAFSVTNAMSYYNRAAQLWQFAAESHDSAYVYSQKADGVLQIYVGKYKKVRRSDKLSDRRAELVDTPLSKLWKEASDWLTEAQKWVDSPDK